MTTQTLGEFFDKTNTGGTFIRLPKVGDQMVLVVAETPSNESIQQREYPKGTKLFQKNGEPSMELIINAVLQSTTAKIDQKPGDRVIWSVHGGARAALKRGLDASEATVRQGVGLKVTRTPDRLVPGFQPAHTFTVKVVEPAAEFVWPED